VDCQTAADGVLVVTKGTTPEWQVETGAIGASLLPGQWSSVSAPAGTHHFSFRCRPWDGWGGPALAFLGIILVIAGVWTRDSGARPEMAAGDSTDIQARAPMTDDRDLN